MRLVLLLILMALPARAQVFDHYVLALSWSPGWCATQGGPDAAQCRRDLGFIVHGLWPQNDDDWPEWCDTDAAPTRAEREALSDITDPDLALHEWRKHGSCTGLPPAGYYELTRAAWDRVTLPAALQNLRQDRPLSARQVEAAFLEANPDMSADGVTVTCREGHIAEVRLCLTRDLTPRPCAASARRDCRGPATMDGR
ncbi:ribonuclease T2 family protein [Falsirhodobacter algicola]|uniref:Ribonuclease T n=1 Tax=Falsirhodobacter algicola TaxID=2692330 RepID=A0A8J8MUP1_9RHOB|nr:ribonuclease T2 [Falsirhodobacter algicola]QUS36784.1 ribonuclease T [Falsirhodobacter algicola]